MQSQPITEARVIELWRHGIARYGGDQTERESDPGCVEKSISASINGAYYLSEGAEVNPLHLAGLLLFYLVRNHCFLDGNKRVGWMAAVEVLLTDDIVVCAEEEEVVQFVLEIASGQRARDSVIDWFGNDGRLTARQ